jgi:hypothetical protein
MRRCRRLLLDYRRDRPLVRLGMGDRRSIILLDLHHRRRKDFKGRCRLDLRLLGFHRKGLRRLLDSLFLLHKVRLDLLGGGEMIAGGELYQL